ncbi:MAG TPA: Crp/Fnr family transcriptional regulator [Pyrinomonadaceae bacterium]
MKVSDNGSNGSIPVTCANCDKRSELFFCNLSEAASAKLHSLKFSHKYSRGSTIFMEGQPADGVYLLCSGRAKISTYSEEGRAIILRIAVPGELLGLSAVLSATAYEKTAHASDDCTISFIKKKDFLDLVRTDHEAALKALQQLSNNYHKAHLQICSLGLSSSAADKLARLLLQWFDASANGGPVRISRMHTHGEIAEMIGTSRETVTRMLKDFKDRGLIALTKTEMYIPNRARLKAAIGTRYRNGNGGDEP